MVVILFGEIKDSSRKWHLGGQRGENGDGKRLCLGWWAHDAMCRWCFIVLYTWSLYCFLNQCHTNKFCKKIKIKILECGLVIPPGLPGTHTILAPKFPILFTPSVQDTLEGLATITGDALRRTFPYGNESWVLTVQAE